VRGRTAQWESPRRIIEEVAAWLTGEPGDYPALTASGALRDETTRPLDRPGHAGTHP
jgi:hypothetical protein